RPLATDRSGLGSLSLSRAVRTLSSRLSGKKEKGAKSEPSSIYFMKDWRRSRTPRNVERGLAQLRLTGYYFGASKETVKMICHVRRVGWRSLGCRSLGCRSLACLTLFLAAWIFPAASAAQTTAGLPSETP